MADRQKEVENRHYGQDMQRDKLTDGETAMDRRNRNEVLTLANSAKAARESLQQGKMRRQDGAAAGVGGTRRLDQGSDGQAIGPPGRLVHCWPARGTDPW